MNQICAITPNIANVVEVQLDERAIIREKSISIRKGQSVVVTESQLSDLEQLSLRSNLNLEIVSISNPNQIGTKDVYVAGYISAPEIEEYRLNHGLESQKEVNLLREISRVSGYTMTEVYSHREAIPQGDGRSEELELSLNKWKWKASITEMATDIKDLDLTTKEGLMRAIHLQQSEDRKQAGIKYAHKYYSNHPSVKATEIEKVEKAYCEDLTNPQMVCNEAVADAILCRNSAPLITFFVDGLFKSCEKVFGAATGVKVSRLSKANKTAELIRWGKGE